jgi:4-aminobutyrate aminotransferase/(S)-3-amino-2-methylpropionate transaminase
MSSTTAATRDLLERRAAAVPRGPFNVFPVFADRAQGAHIWDVDGRKYIDFAGGIGALNVGHNHPRVLEAIRAQCDRFLHVCWHVTMYEEYVRLAERLNDLVPMSGPQKTVFFNSGAEAGENAVKIARAFTGRKAVVGFERGFHGRTLLGMTLTGKVHPYTAGFGPFAPEVYRLPYRPFFAPGRNTSEAAVREDAKAALDRLFHYHVEPGEIALLMLEPVLGEGGFFPVHPAALEVLRDACREHGILFAADEVQAGMGRAGAMFAIERYGVVPDLVLTAKSLGGGLPLSAVTGPAEIMDAPPVGGIGGTFGGNPVACAAGNAVLDVLQEEKLPERARVIGERVMTLFEGLRSELPHVADARGLGAMCALEIVDPESGAPDPGRTAKIVERAREGGVLVMTASGNVIRTLMPLVITHEDLDRGLDVLAEAVGQVA